MPERTILHVDMNNCFASIELIDHPEWRGLPLAVCGAEEERRGIVLAKSQEAKVFGIRTGEPVWEARQKCPELLIVPPHHEKYLHYSRLARAIYERYSPRVEPFGLDECWLDASGSADLFGSGRQLAERIRLQIKRELQLTVSIGVSFNKVFAKLGSDLKKPDAVTEISPADFKDKVWPLPVAEMLGVGRKTERKLQLYGVRTIGDLAALTPDLLRQWFGVNGYKLWRAANGQDDSPVRENGQADPIQSISHGLTCREDLERTAEVKSILLELAQDVANRLHQEKMRAWGVQISVKDRDLLSQQYQARLDFATQSAAELARAAQHLFESHYSWRRPVRALSIAACHLEPQSWPVQLSLFPEQRQHERIERLETSVYALRERYGMSVLAYSSQTLNVKLPGQRQFALSLPGPRNWN